MILYYDRAGQPIDDVRALAKLWEDDNYRRVAYTEINEEVAISTVWLGIDRNCFSPGSPPLIFETMVFGGPLHQAQTLSSTEVQALAVHDQIVAEASEHLRENH